MGFKSFISRQISKIEPKLPDVMMGLGTVCVVGGTVMACKATTELPAIVNEYKEEKKRIADTQDDQKEAKKEVRKLRLKTAGKIAVNYGPAVVVEAGGITSMWHGYGKVKTALVGLSTTCMGIQRAFDMYRENVRQEYGEEADQKMMYGYHEEEVVHTDDEGESRTEKIKVYPNEAKDMPSMYARYFSYNEADGAEKSIQYNEHFLECMEKVANQYLQANKRMTLNEVYELLGIKKSVAGNHVGWIYDKRYTSGDQYIDLRARIVYRKTLDGWERVWMIDPNVDGAMEEKALALGLFDA